MPVHQDSELKTMAVILSKEQIARMKVIQAKRARIIGPVSFSQIAREVVASGLRAYDCGRDMEKATSGETERVG